jgi:pyruvate formate lyase activating enzyme
MAQCINCGKESRLISTPLSMCADCIRNDFENVLLHIQKVHFEIRKKYNLPPSPPRDPHGKKCTLCVNQCQIPEGEIGYCGLRKNVKGKIMGGGIKNGNLSLYHDSLPTNCVADWVCAGGSEAGYPEYSYFKGAEYGYKNLAVFYQACSFDCLFCQNWHYRESVFSRGKISAEELSDNVDPKTSCICYFGGDPTPQLIHAIKTSRLALKKNQNRTVRICWETNGTMNQKLLKIMAELSLKSGGCIKFDLKAFDQGLNIALCGVTNKRTLDNFKFLSQFIEKRPDPPFLIASTLLVPGYVDVQEVKKISEFIANLNPEIPYSLLAFYPCFYMSDLPTTSRKHALEAKKEAEKAGLKRVKIGNLHLLGDAY